MNYGCETSRHPFCCGMIEAGNFVVCQGSTYRSNQENSPEKLLAEVLENHAGYPVSFNFYRSCNWDEDELTYEEKEYEMEPLRQLVMKHPKAIHICERINPNSGNRVDSWVIFEGEIPYCQEDD